MLLFPEANVRLLSNPQCFRFVTSGDEFLAACAIRLHPLFHATDMAMLESRLGQFGWHKLLKKVGGL
jgi:hypothetical protein